jgi:hypothetical protein
MWQFFIELICQIIYAPRQHRCRKNVHNAFMSYYIYIYNFLYRMFVISNIFCQKFLSSLCLNISIFIFIWSFLFPDKYTYYKASSSCQPLFA